MIIREVKREDLPSIAMVQIASNRSTYIGIMPDDYLNSLSQESKAKEWDERLFGMDSTEFMYVAEDTASSIVGFIAASRNRTHDFYEREISSIYILEEFQRKGLGRLLIKAVLTKFAEDNVRSMILWTLKDNPSRLFYEHLGGKAFDRRVILRGGKEMEQLAYIWEDITWLL